MLSYTAEELERETGFDRRTIAYYIQEGLIPRVGRRGPRTRYPKLVRDRLLFIRRVREAEESGAITPVSLTVMGELFARLSPEAIASVADGQTPVAESLGSPGSTHQASMGPRRDAINTRGAIRRSMPPNRRPERALRRPGAAAPPELPEIDASFDSEEGVDYSYSPDFLYMEEVAAASESAPDAAAGQPSLGNVQAQSELADTLIALQEAARRRQKLAPTSVDTWSRIEISPDIALSVRGIADEDAGLLEKVRIKLQQLMSGRRG